MAIFCKKYPTLLAYFQLTLQQKLNQRYMEGDGIEICNRDARLISI